MEAKQTSNALTSSNTNYQIANALQIRLNTQPILDEIKTFLSGVIDVIEEKDGKISVEHKQVGTPKANEAGIQSIMSRLTSLINTQTVQGNYEEDMYHEHIYRIHKSLASMIVLNRYTWGVKTSDISYIVDFIMDLVEPFFSRLISNKERESYAETIKHFETQSHQQRGGFDLFRKSGG